MGKYIGVKMVEAVPMTELTYLETVKGMGRDGDDRHGYKITYPDGYVSWSPKNVFEKAYMQVGNNNTIVEKNISDFILDYNVKQWGEKTTIVMASLANGFILTESSSCVDAANFNMDIGESICKEKIKNRLWEMLGFLLQTAKNGVKKCPRI